jgi:tetratricopeptide (TPR) repeat protein
MKHDRPLILVLAVAFILIAGCTSNEMQLAKEYIGSSMYENAITVLELEIEKDPKNAEAYFLLGQCYLETLNTSRAEDMFEQAIALNKNLREEIGNLYFERSLMLFVSNNFGYAEQFFHAGLQFYPAGVKEYSNRLFDYAMQAASQDSHKAIEIFRFLSDNSPGHKSQIPEAAMELARNIIDGGMPEEAFTLADFALESDTNYRRDVAMLYMDFAAGMEDDQIQPAELIHYYDKALEINQEYAIEVSNHYHRLALEYESKNEINNFMLFAQKCYEINNSYETWYLEIKEKYKPPVPVNGLIAYYPFNGNARDESGNGNDGRVYGAKLVADRNMQPSAAYVFDGRSDYIDIQNPLIKNGSSSFTIAAWIKSNGSQNQYSVPISQGASHYSGLAFQYGWPSPDVFVFIYAPPHSDWYVADFKTDLENDREWHFYTITYDGRTFNAYKDNNWQASIKSGIRIGNDNFNIGRDTKNAKPNHRCFNGIIDDIYVYDRALSLEEISALFAL